MQTETLDLLTGIQSCLTMLECNIYSKYVPCAGVVCLDCPGAAIYNDEMYCYNNGWDKGPDGSLAQNRVHMIASAREYLAKANKPLHNAMLEVIRSLWGVDEITVTDEGYSMDKNSETTLGATILAAAYSTLEILHDCIDCNTIADTRDTRDKLMELDKLVSAYDALPGSKDEITQYVAHNKGE